MTEPAAPSLFMVTAGVLGGVGLFLLGMKMLTDGLKLAAGRALEGLLQRWTSTPLRGLAAGMLITTLVQSSSAVTVASIGFVNAGMLSLRHAVWVIFGSNVGTTMNAWLVATLGFSIKIDAFALPFIGIGSLLSLAARTVRPAALGQALAGFGVLFLGIDVLKDTFSAFGAGLPFEQFVRPDLFGWVMLVAIGTVLTVLMQASGAAIAIVITAAQGGLMSIEAACAMVIGTNIGTTSTAILSAVGATANARRLAAAHVFFNLITGAAALLLLPLLIALLGTIRELFDQPATPAVMIALFHSVFNVLGVLLMVPAAPWLLRMLSRRFRSREEAAAQPQHLDASSVSVPDLALRALGLELDRTQSIANACLKAASKPQPDEAEVSQDQGTLDALASAINAFVTKLTSANLPAVLVDKLARSLRVLQYQQNTAATCTQAAQLAVTLGPMPTRDLTESWGQFRAAVVALVETAATGAPDFRIDRVEAALDAMQARYEQLKETLLMAGAHGTLDVHAMQERLRQASLTRRAAEQTAKAARHLAALRAGEQAPTDPVTVADAYDGETT